jgi:hypothetical protein
MSAKNKKVPRRCERKNEGIGESTNEPRVGPHARSKDLILQYPREEGKILNLALAMSNVVEA